MSRGNRRQDIFLNDVDRHDFLKTLAEACRKTVWQAPAFCLMSDNYHLVPETPNADLVAGMAWLQSTYTIRRFAEQMQARQLDEESLKAIRDGWYAGSEAFLAGAVGADGGETGPTLAPCSTRSA